MSKVDAYIETIVVNLKPVVSRLRNEIKVVSKDFKEEIKWGVITYSINKDICSINAHNRHVNLQIFRGGDIKDVQLLEGTGKSMRHLKFKTLADVDSGLVRKIIKQAIAVDALTFCVLGNVQ